MVGIAIALSKFDEVRSVGRALLTSSAIAAAVVGFAARQTLANVVAGLMLAVTQPLRLGDRIVFDDVVGTVEDVTLSYTFVRGLAGERIAIPNEKLAAGILRNDTLGADRLAVEADVWIAPDADVAARARAVRATPTWPRPRRRASGSSCATATRPVGERAGRQDELRARALAALHEQGSLRRP